MEKQKEKKKYEDRGLYRDVLSQTKEIKKKKNYDPCNIQWLL